MSAGIVIFGAGYRGRELLHSLHRREVLCFVDNNSMKQGTQIEGINVLPPEELKKLKNPFIVYIASMEAQKIRDQLAAMGIRDNVRISHLDAKWGQVNEGDVIKEKDALVKAAENYQIDDGRIKTIALGGYNTDTPNWGCRATCLALREILGNVFWVKDYIYRNEILRFFPAMEIDRDVYLFCARIKITSPTVWGDLSMRLAAVDALVINGEGSFIFGNYARQDLYVFLILMVICIELGKPFFVINAMISGQDESHIDEESLLAVLKLFEKARGIYVRDPVSLDIVNRYDAKIKAEWIPDALFGMNAFYEMKARWIDMENIDVAELLPFNEMNDKHYDVEGRYVVLSGNSLAAWYPEKSYHCFSVLVLKLKEKLQKKNCQLVLMECCTGDALLKRIAKEQDILLVPVETNLTVAYAILRGAIVYCSGRYHPSILASMGGTPCVLMGCNSHKTWSLQYVLGEEKPVCYAAIPNEAECERIVDAVMAVVESADDGARERLKERCKALGKKSELLGEYVRGAA